MLDGEMVEGIGRRSETLVSGAVIYKPTDTRHRNTFGAAGAKVVTLSFAEHQGREIGMARSTVIVRHSERLRAIAGRIARELTRESPDATTELLIEGLSLELTAEALRTTRGRRRAPPPWLASTREQIASDVVRPRTIADYAQCAGVHPSHLARLFRLHFGESIGRYVRQLRLELAMRRLAESDEPIARVALSAGFADQSHLSHVFRRHVGVSPSEYRRQRSQPARRTRDTTRG